MLHWPYITNRFKGYFSICSTNLHRHPLWHFMKANKHMLTTKNCCSSTWLFDWGINPPFVHQKRGYLFSCASFSWAPQFMPFPVMLHGTWRMSASPLIQRELNLVGISQGFHQCKVSADTSLPSCEKTLLRSSFPALSSAAPGVLSGSCRCHFRAERAIEIKSQPLERNAGSTEHHRASSGARRCTHGLGWALQWASAAALRGAEHRQAKWRRRITPGTSLQEEHRHRGLHPCTKVSLCTGTLNREASTWRYTVTQAASLLLLTLFSMLLCIFLGI